MNFCDSMNIRVCACGCVYLLKCMFMRLSKFFCYEQNSGVKYLSGNLLDQRSNGKANSDLLSVSLSQPERALSLSKPRPIKSCVSLSVSWVLQNLHG